MVWVCPCSDIPEIWLQAADGSPSRFPTTGEFEESAPRVSPNGRWLAYISEDGPSGMAQVFVQPFPGGGRATQISPDGGSQPLWSRDGSELFYRKGSPTGNQMLAVRVQTEPEFIALAPRVLFEGDYEAGLFSSALPNYDVSAADQFLMLWRGGIDGIDLVQNFFDELQRLVPTQ